MWKEKRDFIGTHNQIQYHYKFFFENMRKIYGKTGHGKTAENLGQSRKITIRWPPYDCGFGI